MELTTKMETALNCELQSHIVCQQSETEVLIFPKSDEEGLPYIILDCETGVWAMCDDIGENCDCDYRNSPENHTVNLNTSERIQSALEFLESEILEFQSLYNWD
jgi:hypothetical protein